MNGRRERVKEGRRKGEKIIGGGREGRGLGLEERENGMKKHIREKGKERVIMTYKHHSSDKILKGGRRGERKRRMNSKGGNVMMI